MSSERIIPLIDTVVIPVGGFGTRMFPHTMAVSKALLPAGDKPLIMHAVDEAIGAGVHNIIIPCRPEEVGAYTSQFTVDEDVIEKIKKTGRMHLLERIQSYEQCNIEIVPIFAKEGPGSTIAQLVRDRNIGAFGIILPDDLMLNDGPVFKKLIGSYEQTGNTTVGTRQVSKAEDQGNGTYVLSQALSDGFNVATNIQVKQKEYAPISDQVTCGRYIFDKNFVQHVEACDLDGLKEVSMSAVVRHLTNSKNNAVNIVQILQAQYYDCGDLDGYCKAQAALLPHGVLREEFSKRTAASEKPNVSIVSENKNVLAL